MQRLLNLNWLKEDFRLLINFNYLIVFDLLKNKICNLSPNGGGFQNPGLFNNNNYGSSSALANAASQGQHFGPNGFGGGAANAQAQAFNSQGPLGGFGAAAANTQSQNFNAGPGGISVNIV